MRHVRVAVNWAIGVGGFSVGAYQLLGEGRYVSAALCLAACIFCAFRSRRRERLALDVIEKGAAP